MTLQLQFNTTPTDDQSFLPFPSLLVHMVTQFNSYNSLLWQVRFPPPNCTRTIQRRNAARCQLLMYYLSKTRDKFITQTFTLLWSRRNMGSLITNNWVYPFRIFLQNLNGLSLTYNSLAFQNDLNLCREYGSAVVSLPETNINWH